MGSSFIRECSMWALKASSLSRSCMMKSFGKLKDEAFSVVYYREMGKQRIYSSFLMTFTTFDDDSKFLLALEGIITGCKHLAENPSMLLASTVPSEYSEPYIDGCLAAIVEFLKVAASDGEPELDEVGEIEIEQKKKSTVIDFPIDRTRKTLYTANN